MRPRLHYCLAPLAVVLGLVGGPSPAVAQDEPAPRVLLKSIPSDSVSFMVGGRVVLLGTPLAPSGVEVYIPGTTIETRTDRHGVFRLDTPSGGPAELRFRLINFRELCVNVTFEEDVIQSLLIEVPRDWRGPPGPRSPCIDPETAPR